MSGAACKPFLRLSPGADTCGGTNSRRGYLPGKRRRRAGGSTASTGRCRGRGMKSKTYPIYLKPSA